MFLSPGSPAQQKESDVRFRLAQSYERSGNYETAAKLYEELFAKDSLSPVLYDALRRMYLELKRYDDALALVQARLQKSPSDLVTLIQLGTVYMRSSDEKNALEAWERAVATGPKSEITYRLVCDAMVENRVFDHAIELYRRGRAALNNPTMFALELSYLYAIALNYADATREYLNVVRGNPQQLTYVQSRIATYTNRADGLSAATLVVEQAVQAESDNVTLLQLLSWLYMEGKRFDNAYTIYRQLDDRKKAGGQEIYNFAELALKERAYPAATKAFHEVIDKYPSLKQIPQAKFGYARTLEEASGENDTLKLFGGVNPFVPKEKPATESQPTFTGAIAAYKRIVSEYPGTEIAARALLRTAVVAYERFFNVNDARSSLEEITRSYTSYLQVLLEAKLLLGDVYLSIGDLDKAQDSYQSMMKLHFGFTDYLEKAQFRIAEILYFRGKFKDALAQLQDLAKNPASDIANDALALQIFVQEHMQPTETALVEFAKADLLQRQRKLSEALAILDNITKTYKDSPIIDDAYMRMGDILTQMNRFAEAAAAYQQLQSQYPESIMIDRMLMKLGEVYQLGLNDKPRAIESFKTLLERFPNSIYVNEARKRIRDLRGDTL